MSAAMDDMLACFAPLYFKAGDNVADIKTLLSMAKDIQIFTSKRNSLQEVLSYVHTCLNSSAQRIEGLLILSGVLDQCLTDVFTQNAITWLKFLLQILQSHDAAPVKKIACHVCCQLLDVCSVFTVLSKEVAGSIPQLLPLLLTASFEWRAEAVMVINSCIENYRGSCGPFKNKLDTFVIGQLGQTSVPKEVVRCYTLLAGCGGGGSHGTKYAENWTVQYQRVMGSLHSVLSHIYDGLEEDIGSQTFGLPTLYLGDVPESYNEKLSTCVARLNTLIQCLQSLLSEVFPTTIQVPVEEILNFIYRVCCVHCKRLQAIPSTERMLLSGYTPELHRYAVQLLPTLLKRFKTLLLPQTKQIMSVLIQELMWTHEEHVYGQDKPYSALRAEVYCCLSTWFQVSKCFIEITREEDNLLEELLHDAKPQVDTLKVNSSVVKQTDGLDPPPAKKKKKGGYQEISHGISSQRKLNLTANSELTAASLDAMYWLVLCCGQQLKAETYQSITDFVVTTNMKVQQSRDSPGIPYLDGGCRLGLLRVLQACVLVPHPKTASPLQCGLNIFRIASLDSYSQVSCFCIEAQRLCEVLIHPRAPCFIKPKTVESRSQSVTLSANSRLHQNLDPPHSINNQSAKAVDYGKQDSHDSGESDIESDIVNTRERNRVKADKSRTEAEVSKPVLEINKSGQRIDKDDRTLVSKPSSSSVSHNNECSNSPNVLGGVDTDASPASQQEVAVKKDDNKPDDNTQKTDRTIPDVPSVKYVEKDKGINDTDTDTGEKSGASNSYGNYQPVPSTSKVILEEQGSPIQIDENGGSDKMECDSTQQDKESEEVETMLMAFMDVDPE